MPGDSFSLKTSFVVRETTLLTPVMDNLYLDIWYYYVPMRLLWEHWKEFMGENTSSSWVAPTTYTIPQVISPVGGWLQGTLADYFGIPTKKSLFSVSALPFRAYCLIYNEWFRDQNLQNDTVWLKNDGNISGSNGSDSLSDPVKGGMPLKVAKYHDYFTSCLPAPQKGQPVSFPFLADAEVHSEKDKVFDTTGDDTIYFSTPQGSLDVNRYMVATPAAAQVGKSVIFADKGNNYGSVDSNNQGYLIPSNLWARLSKVSSVTVNDMRFAFQLQKMLERDARGGTRYTELIRSHFGIVSPDSRQQRPEYLGGVHKSLNASQVLQTSSSKATPTSTPQATTTAYSLTGDSRHSFTKSFTEHGYVIGLAAVRPLHTYQQGLEKFWSRQNRLDFFDPVFANIGEQPVFNREIYLDGSDYDGLVFGYQEAWADYRYKPNRVSGLFRSNATGTLDIWHYADNYENRPVLGSAWIEETADNVDRTLAISKTNTSQFIADFYFENRCIRPMPLFSTPGNIDRN